MMLIINKKKFTDFINQFKDYEASYLWYLDQYYNTKDDSRFNYLQTAYMYLNFKNELVATNKNFYKKAKELRAI